MPSQLQSRLCTFCCFLQVALHILTPKDSSATFPYENARSVSQQQFEHDPGHANIDFEAQTDPWTDIRKKTIV